MSADRNLLFGILALQMDFVSRDGLIAAMNAWVLAKHRPLADILGEQGSLKPAHRALLEPLVEAHLAEHDNDPQKSLAALSSVDEWLRRQLASVEDADVQQSIGHVRPGRDPNSTIDLPPASGVRYRILRPHAKGALGEVFVAEDTELGRSVALKEIQSHRADDADSRSRFVREAEITGGLEHPGIVPVYGLGAYDDGRPFYAMRFIRGDNLLQAIKRFHGEPGASATGVRPQNTPVANAPGSPGFDSLEFRQLLRRFIDVCNAVAYAHSRGVLHRDLKPGNIMLGKYGETLVVDWGLAKPTGRSQRTGTPEPGHDESTLYPRLSGDSSETMMGQPQGTPAYMSPEQAAGKLDELGPATDIYSLGATLYHLLTGRVAFTDPDMGLVLFHIEHGEFPRPREMNPAVPRALEAVCVKAMSLRQADRFGSALDLAKEVERWLADEPVTSYREPVGARVRRWVRRHYTLVSGAIVLLVTGTIALFVGIVLIDTERAQKETARQEAVRERNEKDEALQDALHSNFQLTDILNALVESQGKWTDEQRTLVQEMAKDYEKIAERGDATDRYLAAAVRGRLGHFQQRVGDFRGAEDSMRFVIGSYTKLAAEYPDRRHYRLALSYSHFWLARVLLLTGHLEEGEAYIHAGLSKAEAESYGLRGHGHAIMYYSAAALYAIAATTIKEDSRLADRYATRSVELLRQALAAGYADIPHLLADADLAALRSREDYASLLWDLADTPAPISE